MNPRTVLFLFKALLCAVALLAPAAFAQSTAFTYQGKLDDNGQAATGLYEMTFALYAQPDAVAPLPGASATLTVPVTNGLFTVMIDFGSGPFDGSPRWMQTSVRLSGSMSPPVALLPRTAVGSTPYATYAKTAGSVAAGAIGSAQLAPASVGGSKLADGSVNSLKIASGSVVKSLNGLHDDVNLIAGANVTLTPIGNTLTIASGGGSGAWTQVGSSVSYSGGNVGIGMTGPLAKLQVNQAGNSGIGVFAGDRSPFGAALFETDVTTPGTHAWFAENGERVFSVTAGGDGYFKRNLTVDGELRAHSLIIPGGVGSPDTQGEFVVNDFSPPQGPFTALFPRFIVKQNANVGIGTRNPSEKLHVNGNFLRVEGGNGEAAYLGGDGVGNDVQVGSLNPNVQNVVLYNAANNGLMDVVARNATVGGDLHLINGAHGMGYRENFAGSYIDGPVIYGFNGGGLGTSNPDDLALSWDWQGNVSVKNNLSTCSLTIRGGCDLAEPFQMSEAKLDEGSVVVIDEANPGHLKQATSAYDSRVAGIISGANGIHPGISLHQEGALEGGQNVALTGRVYVKADAGYGAIKPGDLLTTSDTPGHAMKVGDSSRAQGAILGKAMTTLTEGTGMVLVLVSLQ
jgi:hypothetical protein